LGKNINESYDGAPFLKLAQGPSKSKDGSENFKAIKSLEN